MKTKFKPGHLTLFVLIIMFILGAVMTILPSNTSYVPSILGYKTLCPMAPVSTAGCLILAALTWVIRRIVFKHKAE